MGTYWAAGAISMHRATPVFSCNVGVKQQQKGRNSQQSLSILPDSRKRSSIEEAGGACFLASAALAACFYATWAPSVAHAALSRPCVAPFSTYSLSQAPLSPGAQSITLPDSGSLCTESDAPPVKLSEEGKEVSNEYIVAEAWQVVNDRFLDARSNQWSSEAWLRKREEILKREIPSRRAAHGIIKNMLSELHDPYTRFITPAELKQLSKYDMTGIGISLGEEGPPGESLSGLRVVGVVLGSSGHLAGIKQGDELMSVNGIGVHGKSVFEASSLIQGLKGTFVSIEIRHNHCKDTQLLSVERTQTVQTPVYFRLEHRAGDLVGYIRLKEFNAVARRHLVTAMKKLTEAGATSFVLDLRDNPGGLVQVGIEIARLFLDQGDTVVYTASRNPEDQKAILANSPPLTKAPLVVFVNEHTASASEIVAAALHDNCRAVLVGRKTFGKALIQSVFELSDGSGVIITVGKYVTPRHEEIDENGIVPDFQQLPDLVDVKKKISSCSAQDQALL